jgi:hypothetical protein
VILILSLDFLGPKCPATLTPPSRGGLKLDAWFERSSDLSGINFPAWMKDLGFYLDFSYHRLNMDRTFMNSVAWDRRGVFGGPTVIPL